MSKSSPGKYRKFVKDGKEYLFTQYDLLRIKVLEKSSSVVAVLIMVMIGIVLLTSVWVYASVIIIFVAARALNNFIVPVIIMGGINLLMFSVVVIFREKLILNPLIKIFSKVLFDNSDEEEVHDDENENEK